MVQPLTADAAIDPRYNVPVIDHGTGEPGNLIGEAIHKLHLDSGRTLDWYAKLAPAAELYVTLQGAVPGGKGRYPRFQRVKSMRDRVPAFISISDPTFQLNDNENMRIGWYTGSAAWDPLPEIADLVGQVMRQIGAEHVAFIGGSAGGHGALRLSPQFPQSLALVTDPQTSVVRYHRQHWERYFASCWPEEDHAEVLASAPHRFDMCRLYAESDPNNFVYYRQSTHDNFHVREHANPFLASFNMEGGTSVDGRRRFAFEEGVRKGHGAITAEEFDRVFGDAVSFWRERRDAPAGEDPRPSP